MHSGAPAVTHPSCSHVSLTRAHEVAHVLHEHLTCTRAVGSSEAEVGAEAAGRAGKPGRWPQSGQAQTGHARQTCGTHGVTGGHCAVQEVAGGLHTERHTTA